MSYQEQQIHMRFEQDLERARLVISSEEASLLVSRYRELSNRLSGNLAGESLMGLLPIEILAHVNETLNGKQHELACRARELLMNSSPNNDGEYQVVIAEISRIQIQQWGVFQAMR